MRALLTVLTLGMTLRAQPVETLSQLLDLARQAGPEYFSDAAFRVLEGPRVLAQSAEKQLLAEVFERAGDIRIETPYYAARTRAASERARALVQSQTLRMDRLAVRMRVIERLIVLQDARQARKLWQNIDLPQPARPGCADWMVPVSGAYWDTLSALVLQDAAFTALERERGVPAQFFEERLRMIRTATDLGPAAQATLRVLAERDSTGVLIAALGSALGAVNDSDRAFSYAVERLGVVENTLSLAQTATRRRLPVGGLVTSLRGFLVRHYQGDRCVDTAALPDATPRFVQGPDAVAAYRPIDTFNRLAPPLVAQLQPIYDRDRQPSRLDSSVPAQAADLRWTLNDLQNRMARLERLRYGGEDYRAFAAETGRMLHDWKEGQVVNGLEFFHQKTLALRQYVQAVPSGDLFRTAVGDYFDLLLTSPARREAPAEWLVELNGLLMLTRDPEDRRGMPRHASSGFIVQTLVESYDPLLRLYGRLEQMYPVKR